MENSRRLFIKKIGLYGVIITGSSSILKGSLAEKDPDQTVKEDDPHFPPGR